jgi:predicted ArsR family transcriptional regulator
MNSRLSDTMVRQYAKSHRRFGGLDIAEEYSVSLDIARKHLWSLVSQQVLEHYWSPHARKYYFRLRR